MARKDLQDFADYLELTIAENVQEYRELYANWEAHVVTVEEKELTAQVTDQLKTIVGGNLSSTQLKAIEDSIPGMLATIYRAFGKSKQTKYFQVTALEGSVTDFKFKVASMPKSGSYRGSTSVFDYIKRVKRRAQKPLLEAIDKTLGDASLFEQRERYSRKGEKILGDDNKPKTYRTAKVFLDIGHDETTTVAKSRMEAALIAVDAYKFSSPEAEAFVKKLFLTNNPVYLELKKSPKKFPRLVEYKTSIISERLNKSQAADDKKKAGYLQKRLNQLLNSIDSDEWANLPGSDTPVDIVVKNQLNEFHDIGTKKGRKTNIKKQKINNTARTVKTKKRSGKYVKPSGTYSEAPQKVGGKKSGSRSRAKKSGIDIRTLIGPLNQKLPEQVRKNMRPPRLQNQTGRFASSVRVTDINFTPQGYPSIGYTYMKYPYQTFEPGFVQGSEDRDPRKLIDKSIRELAIQFALGRFYTRRV